MKPLQFVPHDGPQVDFFITSNDTPELSSALRSIGATRTSYDAFTSYVWNDRLGKLFMSGAGVIDGSFYIGPRRLPSSPRVFGCGNYLVIDLTGPEATVRTDPFGYIHTFHSDSFVTNRLHLAALAVGKMDVASALSATYDNTGFSFGFNCLKMPVQGVSLLQAGHSITVGGRGVAVTQDHLVDEFGELSPFEYWNLIERGAEELVGNIRAVIDSGLPVFADVTGGRDSRVVFGAIVAAGKQDQAIFNTIANPTTPGLKKDLEVATGLVSRYGGSYGERPRAAGYSHHTVAENLLRRRSQVFGAYHWIVPSDLRPVSALSKLTSVRMLGGGGEVYRDRWHKLLFTEVDVDQAPDNDYMRWALRNHRVEHAGTEFSNEHLDLYIDYLVSTFESLPGSTVGHKLDSHFLNFRNRSHFGPRQSISESLVGISLASSPNLLAASRGLPGAERASGRVIFDVIRTLDEELAYLPFDSPTDPNIFASPYHRRSKFDGREMSLEPALQLVGQRTHQRRFSPTIRPDAEKWDIVEVFDNEISEGLEGLRSNNSRFRPFVRDGKLERYVDWARTRSLAQHSAAASKIRALSDFESTMLD